MPLLTIIRNPHNQLGIWALEESAADLGLLIDLSSYDQGQMEKFSSQFRIREFLAVRILLTELLGCYPEIGHDRQHRPFLTNSRLNVSISHSRSLVAVILSDKPAGVDTEETNRDISHIANRFMNLREISWTLSWPDPNHARVLCWSIKESVFKLMGIGNVDFRSMIEIDPIESGFSGTASVNFRKDEKAEMLTVNYLFERNNVITWCELP